MEIVNRLRSAVSTVQSSVTAAIPGNLVLRENVVSTQAATAGSGLVWKIYNAVKKSTNKVVSVWVFEKKLLDGWPIHDRELMLTMLKQGVAQLTRLRHPRLLTVEQPLEESRDCYAFATEPVFASLANVLGRADNMADLPDELMDLKFTDLEICHGLLQLCGAMSFLHNDAKLLHRNICPESVILTRAGHWKLACFDFSALATISATEQMPQYPQIEWLRDVHPNAQPKLDYVAPEHILGGKLDGAADMFSFGVLLYAIFHKGRSPYDNGNNLSTFKRNVEQLKTPREKMFESFPPDLRDYAKMCLNVTSDLRPDANQFTKIKYFDNTGVRTLNFLESLCQLDNLQKSQFFKSLPAVLSQLPDRILLWKVLPFLTSEFSTPDMVPFVLPNFLLIAEKASKQDYQKFILPPLLPVLQMHKPVQNIFLLLQKMDLFLSKSDPEVVRTHFLPLIYAALDSDTSQVQDLCLTEIVKIVSIVDAESMRISLLPKILRLVTDQTVLSTKVNALMCLGKVVGSLQKWMVSDQVLPALPRTNSKESAVIMAVLGIYRLVLNDKRLGITKEICARSCLPFLLPLTIENSLNLNQFSSLMSLIREMLTKIESDQKSKLAQLSALDEEQRAGFDLSKIKDAGVSGTVRDPVNTNETNKVGGLLSLEEKQRLAKEQESALKVRKEGPSIGPASALGPQVLQPLAPPPGGLGLSGAVQPKASNSNPPVKDLTSTLMSQSFSRGNAASGSMKGAGSGLNWYSPVTTIAPRPPMQSTAIDTRAFDRLVAFPTSIGGGPSPRLAATMQPTYSSPNPSFNATPLMPSAGFGDFVTSPQNGPRPRMASTTVNWQVPSPPSGSGILQPQPVNAQPGKNGNKHTPNGNAKSRSALDDFSDFVG